MHAVPLSAFSCVAPPAALGDYSCVPGCHRLFCRLCGSYVAWQQDARLGPGVHGSVDVGGRKVGKGGGGDRGRPDGRADVVGEGEVEICVGTLDEEFLVGARGPDRNVLPGTGFGALLAHPRGRVLWGENDIVGVTDRVPGRRFKYGTDANIMMPEH